MQNDKNFHRVVFFMNKARYQAFKGVLATKGITVSSFLRKAIDKHLAKHENIL